MFNKYTISMVVMTILILPFKIYPQYFNTIDSTSFYLFSPNIIDSLSIKYQNLTELELKLKNDTDLKKALLQSSKLYKLTKLGICCGFSELPVEILLCNNIEELDLGGNNFQKIPGILSKLSKLETLDLDNNKLCYPPEPNFCLNNLKCLSLSNNNLSALSYSELNKFFKDSLYFPKLEALRLANNQLEFLPVNILNYKNIAYLYLVGNNFCEFPDFLNKFNNLQNVAIDYNIELRNCLIGDCKALSSLDHTVNFMINNVYTFDQEFFKLLQKKYSGKIIFTY